MAKYLTKNETKFNDFVDFFNNNENVMEINSKKSYLDYDIKQNKANYYILYQNEISKEVLDSTNEISNNMKNLEVESITRTYMMRIVNIICFI